MSHVNDLLYSPLYSHVFSKDNVRSTKSSVAVGKPVMTVNSIMKETLIKSLLTRFLGKNKEKLQEIKDENDKKQNLSNITETTTISSSNDSNTEKSEIESNDSEKTTTYVASSNDTNTEKL